MRVVLLLAALALGCPSSMHGAQVEAVSSAPSGKKLSVYQSSKFDTEPREVPEDVVIQAMRASSMFFEEDIRIFAGRIAEYLPKLTEQQRLIIQTNDSAIHVYVEHGELQLVAFREGLEVSRHASAIPAAAVKTELAAKPRPAPPPQKEIVVVHAAPAEPTNTEKAKELAETGHRQFNVASYAAAIDSWKQAYVMSSDATLLFHIAQAYRLNKDCGEANRFYASYKQAVPNPSNRAELDAGVKACAGKKVATKKKPPPGGEKKLTEAEIMVKIDELDRLLKKQLIDQKEYDEKKRTLLDLLVDAKTAP